MPVHDWLKVSQGIFHDFHNAWVFEIKRVLNSGLLPPDYYALTEQVAGETAPDLITLDLLTTEEKGPSGEKRKRESGATVTMPPPKASITARTENVTYASLQKTVVIRYVEGHEVVAMIEVISRSNKASRAEFETCLRKAQSALKQKIHLLLVDVHPPGRLDPQGTHGALWAALGQEPPRLFPGRNLMAAAYEAGEQVAAYVEPFGLKTPLPDMPLFLEVGRYLNVPLESTYTQAFASVPAFWRARVEGSGNEPISPG
jgi:hypothetical protein